jgi:hypothetical protein
VAGATFTFLSERERSSDPYRRPQSSQLERCGADQLPRQEDGCAPGVKQSYNPILTARCRSLASIRQGRRQQPRPRWQTRRNAATKMIEQFLEPPVSMRCILDDLLHESFGRLAPTEINHCQYEPICPHLNQGLISVSDSGWLILCPTAVAAHRRVRMLIEPKRATIAKREAI